jgi:hypothetical protein
MVQKLPNGRESGMEEFGKSLKASSSKSKKEISSSFKPFLRHGSRWSLFEPRSSDRTVKENGSVVIMRVPSNDQSGATSCTGATSNSTDTPTYISNIKRSGLGRLFCIQSKCTVNFEDAWKTSQSDRELSKWKDKGGTMEMVFFIDIECPAVVLRG